MVCLNRSDHFSKQMVSPPVWWCISGEHQHWGYSPFYRLPRHDHLSGGKMEKLNLSVSLRLTTQRGIFLQNHFLRPTLAPINITAILTSYNFGLLTIWDVLQFHLAKLLQGSDVHYLPRGLGGWLVPHFIIWKVVQVARVGYNWLANSLLTKWGPLCRRLLRQLTWGRGDFKKGISALQTW